MEDSDIIKNDLQIKKFTLEAHNQENRRKLTDNHVMAYFSKNGIPDIVNFINSWEMNANIFREQILKYLVKCDNAEEKRYIRLKAKEAYKKLSDEHTILAILSRNVPNNPLMELVYGKEKEKEKNEEILDNIKKGLKPKNE